MKQAVFYSWQSDLPNVTNRTLIQRALEIAAQAISSDGLIDIEPVVDRDTQGVAGSPDISATIFSKIKEANVFVADVSIVNHLSKERQTPNPNVLVELGFALGVLGDEAVILVFNQAFGAPSDLPFDLRNRRLLLYNMPADETDRASERMLLANKFESALRAALTRTSRRNTMVATTRLPEPRLRKRLDENHRARLTSALGNTSSLRGDLQPRTRQALKELTSLASTTAIEDEVDVMDYVVSYAIHHQDEGAELALGVLDMLLSIDRTLVARPWAKDAHEGCRKLCLGSPAPATASAATRFLAYDAAKDDIETIGYVVGNWSPELYRHARIDEWFAATYRRFPNDTRAMVDLFLDMGHRPEVQARAEQLCDSMRGIEQETARS